MKTDNVTDTVKPLTVEEEMARFTGFTTNNGQTIDPKDKDQTRGPGDRNLSPEEEAAGVKIVGEQPRGKETPAAKTGDKGAAAAAAGAKVVLDDAEKEAAIEGARTLLKLEDGEELTPEEEAEALSKALADKKANNKPGVERDERVRRAQAGRRQAEARAARAEGRLQTLEQRLAALETGGNKGVDKPAAGGKDDATEKEPDPATFDLGELDPKYIRALARWEFKQEKAADAQLQQNQQQTADQRRAAAEFAEKKAAFDDTGLDAFDDFQEVVLDTVNLPKSDPAAWPLSATVGKLLIESKFGPHIAYALASDPKEAKRVDKLSDADKQRWFFRQEAKLESEQTDSGASGDEQDDELEAEKPARRAAAPAAQSKAPPPPKRNNGGGSNRGVSPATTDFAAFEALAGESQRPVR